VNSVSHLCAWGALACLLGVVVWVPLLAIDATKRAKSPSPGTLLAVVSLFGLFLVLLGGGVLLTEDAKRHAGQPTAMDGVMYFVFCGAAGVIVLLASASVALLLLVRRKGRP